MFNFFYVIEFLRGGRTLFMFQVLCAQVGLKWNVFIEYPKPNSALININVVEKIK